MNAFVSGGARSGKSTFAEELALSWTASSGGRAIYLASSRPGDAEMQERIRLHRAGRDDHWFTVEEPYEPERALEHGRTGDVLLWDCLTVWLGQTLYDEACPLDEEPLTTVRRLIERCKREGISLIVVSNDVNEELPIGSEAVEDYVRRLQEIHLELASRFDIVVQAVCGLPIYWKEAISSS